MSNYELKAASVQTAHHRRRHQLMTGAKSTKPMPPKQIPPLPADLDAALRIFIARPDL
jgi:hypothetical protein